MSRKKDIGIRIRELYKDVRDIKYEYSTLVKELAEIEQDEAWHTEKIDGVYTAAELLEEKMNSKSYE